MVSNQSSVAASNDEGDTSDEVDVTVVCEADLGSITVVKEFDCELCETFTRGRYFDGGQFDEEFAQAFPEGITVGEFGPFMTAEDVRNFEHEDPRIEQLLIQYLTLLINIDNCADLLTHELDGTPVPEIRDEALAILTDPDAYSADEVSAAIDAVTAINESSQNEEGNPLTCDTDATVGAEDFTFTLVGPEGEDSQDWGDHTSGETWEGLPAGTYTLTEAGPADVDCVIVSATGAGVVSFDDDSVTIELAEGADVTVTIVNDCEQAGEEEEEFGHISVVKETDEDDPSESFAFVATWDGDGFSLMDGDLEPSGDLLAGQDYTITEELTAAQIAAGWSLDDIECTGTASENIALDGASVTITLVANEDVVCTFTNELEEDEGVTPEEEDEDEEEEEQREGTRGSQAGPGQGTLPNTATMPEPTGSVPAVLLALAMLTGLGAAGYAMQAEARRRR